MDETEPKTPEPRTADEIDEIARRIRWQQINEAIALASQRKAEQGDLLS